MFLLPPAYACAYYVLSSKSGIGTPKAAAIFGGVSSAVENCAQIGLITLMHPEANSYPSKVAILMNPPTYGDMAALALGSAVGIAVGYKACLWRGHPIKILDAAKLMVLSGIIQGAAGSLIKKAFH